jgi:hypothetical protein
LTSENPSCERIFSTHASDVHMRANIFRPCARHAPEDIRFSLDKYVARETGFTMGLLSAIQDYGRDASWCSLVLRQLFGLSASQLRSYVKQGPLDGGANLYNKFPVKKVNMRHRVGKLVAMMEGWKYSKTSPKRLLVLNHAAQLWIHFGIRTPNAEPVRL